MKSKHITTTLALFSTLALVSITVTTVDAKAINSAENTPAGKVTDPMERTVIREITVVNPLSKEKTVIKQVATINVERIKAKHPDMWPEFVAPEFAGYRPSELQLDPVKMTPQMKSRKVTIEYQPFTDKVAPATRFFMLDDVDNPCKSSILIPVHSDQFGRYKLPTPPAGYHYFITNLPKEIQYFPNTGHTSFHLTVKKDENDQGKPASKALTRKVIFHLPAGDKVIEQSARADFVNGRWMIQSFPQLMVPQVDGYVSTVKCVPDLQIEENAINQPVPTFEVQYSKNTSDQKDSSKEKGEEMAQGSKSDSKDSSTATSQTGQEKGSQTTDTAKGDGSTQTENSGISSSTQTDTDRGQDTDTQTSEAEKGDASTQVGESTSSATQTETTDSKDAGTQTSKQQVASENTQTSGGVSAGTQTDGDETKEEGSQTAVVGMEDSASQTENPEKASTATQTEPNIQTSSSATQTDNEVQGGSVATQTDGVLTNSTGTQTTPSVSVGTQTETHSSTASVAIQTEDNGVSKGVQTDSATEESAGTQTETPRLDSSTTQTTNNLGKVSTGIQTSGTIENVASGTQTEGSDAREGVQTDLKVGNNAETQTGDVNGSSSSAQLVSTGSQTETDPSSIVSSSTQTDENTTTTGTQTDNSGVTSTATQASGSQTSDGTQTDESQGKGQASQNNQEEGSNTTTQTHQPVYADDSSQAHQAVKENDSQVAEKGDSEGNNSRQLNGNTQAGEGSVSNIPEMFANHPFSDNSADPTSMRSQGRPGLDHHLQRELNRIQDPLRSLENEPITIHNDQLPQTGNNQSSTKTALLGLVTTAWTAAVSLFVLKRKSK